MREVAQELSASPGFRPGPSSAQLLLSQMEAFGEGPPCYRNPITPDLSGKEAMRLHGKKGGETAVSANRWTPGVRLISEPQRLAQTRTQRDLRERSVNQPIR